MVVSFKIPSSVAITMLQDADVTSALNGIDPDVSLGLITNSLQAVQLLSNPAIMSKYRKYIHVA